MSAVNNNVDALTPSPEAQSQGTTSAGTAPQHSGGARIKIQPPRPEPRRIKFIIRRSSQEGASQNNGADDADDDKEQEAPREETPEGEEDPAEEEEEEEETPVEDTPTSSGYNLRPRPVRINVQYGDEFPCRLRSIYDFKERVYLYKHARDAGEPVEMTFLHGKIQSLYNRRTRKVLYRKGEKRHY
ncbi:hypothetical protein M426DRAFT_18268 [Hypoxylon sp. CI-4A]|nr:hypothetical protein M426DRAFT_18268 [Hypoxylon sp. CI-4A]